VLVFALLFQEDLFPDVSIVRFLIECGASVDCRDFQGDTPLHHAVDCSRPNREVVQLLIDNGAHIDTCNRQSMTPLSLIQRQSPSGPLHNVVFDPLTLCCLAARAVVEAGIDFHNGVVPPRVEKFLLLHVTPDVTIRSGGVSFT
jgi:ankyrin repeat protein